MKYGSLFAGVGGFDLGLDRAGHECGWQVEWNAKASNILAKHWPDVPRYGDIRTVNGTVLPPVAEWIGRQLLAAQLLSSPQLLREAAL